VTLKNIFETLKNAPWKNEEYWKKEFDPGAFFTIFGPLPALQAPSLLLRQSQKKDWELGLGPSP
jgi:hypothetical protein